MIGLKKIELPGIDLALARTIARQALTAAKTGKLGYAIVTAVKHRGPSSGPLGDRVKAQS